MRRKLVKALVVNAQKSGGRLHQGDIVTLDLRSIENSLGETLVRVVGSSDYRFLHRFAIDPIIGGN